MSTPSANISRRARARRFLAVFADPQTYRNLLYLLLAVPISTLSFCLVVTVVATGAGLVVVALLGIPVLVAGWYGVRMLANLDRRAATVLLRRDLPAAPLAGPPGGPWARLVAQTRDSARWRELGFLMLRLPVAVVTATTAVTLLAASATAVWVPFQLWHDGGRIEGDWRHRADLESLATPWSWVLVPVGLALLVVSLHTVNAMAGACGRWANGWLRTPTGSTDLAAAEAATWTDLGATPGHRAVTARC